MEASRRFHGEPRLSLSAAIRSAAGSFASARPGASQMAGRECSKQTRQMKGVLQGSCASGLIRTVASRGVKDTCGRSIGVEVTRQGPCTTRGSCLALEDKIHWSNIVPARLHVSRACDICDMRDGRLELTLCVLHDRGWSRKSITPSFHRFAGSRTVHSSAAGSSSTQHRPMP